MTLGFIHKSYFQWLLCRAQKVLSPPGYAAMDSHAASRITRASWPRFEQPCSTGIHVCVTS